jgi:hypothetical protein
MPGKAPRFLGRPARSLLAIPTEPENKVKAKLALKTGCGGPYGCETSRLPHFLDNRLTDGGEILNLTRRPPFTPTRNVNKKNYHLIQQSLVCCLVNDAVSNTGEDAKWSSLTDIYPKGVQ